MPKRARYLLAWSAKHGRYELYEHGGATSYPFAEDADWWANWLAQHRSFAFAGRQGHVSLLKETRERGSDYWYAYRSQNRLTSKKYAGRSIDLIPARLEELADALSSPTQEPALEHNRISSSPQTQAVAQSPVPEMTEPLLEPKFLVPRLPAALVVREHLLIKLSTGSACKLTLLCAPAGFGKTTLARQWLRERPAYGQNSPVAWIALDSGDNDPIRFWRYVITASQNFQGGSERQDLTRLAREIPHTFEPPSIEAILTTFLNALTRSDGSGLLILEDYHVITSTPIHQTLIFFLQHLPPHMHVMILTRSEPPFPLVRWRASGELCDVQAADLRFSLAESTSFLAFHIPHIPQPVILSREIQQQLGERIEGWAAGLRLLSLSLQKHEQDLAHALRLFAGDQRSLQEYFVTEVLNVQSEELQHFLLSTSILSRLTGTLCDEVIKRHGSALLLEQIERAGLFLEALDGTGTWYRYHALFAEAMQAEAHRRLGHTAVCTLYLRASQWYEQAHMQIEAIETAFQAQENTLALILIERVLEDASNSMLGTQIFQKLVELHTLHRWIEQIPEEVLPEHPLLCLGYAISLTFILFIEQLAPSLIVQEQVERLLRMAEDTWIRENNRTRLGQIYSFRAMILRQPGFMHEAVNYARQALELLPHDATEVRTMNLWLIGMSEVDEGHYTRARAIFLEVRAFYETIGSSGVARANMVWLSNMVLAQGELQQAEEIFRRLLAEAQIVEDLDDICDASLGLALLDYEWNKLVTSEQLAQKALTLAHQLGNYELQVQATLILALIELARGNCAGAQQRCISQLATIPLKWPRHQRLVREIQAMQARVALAQGDLAAVERWWNALHTPQNEISHPPLPRTLRDHEALLWVRWQLQQDRAAETLMLLEELLQDAQTGGRIRMVWEIQLLKSLASAALKRLPTAQRELLSLLAQVQAAGYTRLFLDEGEPLAALLQSTLPTARTSTQSQTLKRLLLAFTQQHSTDPNHIPSHPLLSTPLSAQEQRVLELLAAGHSNPEIARTLVVSVNTIKAQVQSIYHKLNVTNRVEASNLARNLDLL